MDFFESQDVARRKTGRLVLLFVLALVSIIASVYAVVAGAVVYSSEEMQFWHPELLLAVVATTVAVVAGGSLYKIAQLRGGGRFVAESMDGRLIPQDTADFNERKILNVVEEMAIASGTPVPPVYVMREEMGINAFAAGYSPNDAVIGVTRGCLEQLDRDELQGVIAHEFSHILNGDMRLNIRLIGLLNGILIIGIIGSTVMRVMFYSGGGRSRGKDKGGGAAMAILGVAIGLMAIGFLGTMFGNMIKAAVGRQREYLADASAVQFTRNPGGLSGALKRIGASVKGSIVGTPNAVEVSHMFFAGAIKSGFASMMSTHPPLPERIRRIEPGWDGEYPQLADPRGQAPAERRAPADTAVDVAGVITGAAILAGASATGRGGPSGAPADVAESAVAQVGRPTPAHVDYAAQLIAGLPRAVAQASREPYGARAVIYALLINRDEEPRRLQLNLLRERADAGVYELTESLLESIETLDLRSRIPLIDLAAPALRELSASQFGAFRGNVEGLIAADSRLDLFEWVLERILLHHLDPLFRNVGSPAVRHRSFDRLGGPVAILLSALAHAGDDDRAEAELAFQQGRARLGLTRLQLLEPRECGLGELGPALDALDAVSFKLKRKLIEAGAACITADRRVTVRESELLRGVADSLGCPMPPLLPGQPLV